MEDRGSVDERLLEHGMALQVETGVARFHKLGAVHTWKTFPSVNWDCLLVQVRQLAFVVV